MQNKNESKTILIIGAGAVGLSIASWLAPRHKALYILARGEALHTIEKNGLSAYLQNAQNSHQSCPVKLVCNLKEISSPDYIFLCVKNYSLVEISKTIIAQFGDSPVIVAFQNGAENQKILPEFFSKTIFGIVCYNAWLDGPGVVGYQKRGPLVIGTPDNSLEAQMQELQSILNPVVPTVITHQLKNAVISKIILNLTNSFTTLVGFGYQPIENESLLQKVLSQLMFEGTIIAKKAGYKECKLGGMPGWFLIRLSAKLPQWLTRGLFRKNVAKMVVNSMAQDVIAHNRGETELETINGFMLALADKHQVDAPFNRAVYRLCKKAFSDPDFQPVPIERAWQKLQMYGIS